MERKKNLYKIYGSFGFNTRDKDSSIVTQKLGIEPHWSWNKGDKYFIKNINEFCYRSNGIWGYATKPIFIEITSDISPMIKCFKDLLSDKMEIINELINKYQFECDIRIAIFTEEEGVCGASINKDELLFLSHFSYFDISFLQVENVEKTHFKYEWR